MPQFDVISIGAATIDTIVKSKDFKLVKNAEFNTGMAICEMYGSKTELDDFFVSSGGGATNSACSLSHFGLKTNCISAIGNDVFSEFIYDDLTKFGVDTQNLIIKKGEKTAFSVILTAPDGGRTVLVYRGVSKGLNLEQIKNLNIDTTWVYLTNLGLTSKNAFEVIDYLTNKGIKIFWNPGINELNTKDLANFKNIEILSLNIEEAAHLSGIKMDDTKQIIKFLAEKVTAKTILLTLGEKGAFYINKKNVVHCSSLKVKVENTVGAGDAFGSGFLYARIKNQTPEESLKWGIKNSLSVIQKPGAKEGFATNFEGTEKLLTKSL
ncbi:carbohydrate kinase family protein [bacterium]|nr:carbohydrate kinase family protein [bacterium]